MWAEGWRSLFTALSRFERASGRVCAGGGVLISQQCLELLLMGTETHAGSGSVRHAKPALVADVLPGALTVLPLTCQLNNPLPCSLLLLTHQATADLGSIKTALRAYADWTRSRVLAAPASGYGGSNEASAHQFRCYCLEDISKL